MTGEWRLISWLAIGVYGLAVVLAARLAARATGPVAAGLAAYVLWTRAQRSGKVDKLGGTP